MELPIAVHKNEPCMRKVTVISTCEATNLGRCSCAPTAPMFPHQCSRLVHVVIALAAGILGSFWQKWTVLRERYWFNVSRQVQSREP